MKKIDPIDENTTIKEILDKDPSLQSELLKLGFNTCCAKMQTIKNFAQEKQIDVRKAMEVLNTKIEEINEVNEILEEGM
ncbi:DUF1858 domain-containing protein [Athalassotoga saccharophila]|uniref:DUF1858 domain-containing protein n=1 Tax=Athalassotoga saccharophila TaxID=1441386 RepID=UPI0013A56F9E|nr:DUF1858 domain-containing protein [Athalassotoga saccharophila]